MCTRSVRRAFRRITRPIDRLINTAKKKVVNTYKDVSVITKAQNEAKKKAAEAERIARERQAELNRLAEARRATAAQQQAQMSAYEAQLNEQISGQQAQAGRLTAENEQLIATTRARADAVTNSLRILAKDPRKQAPTAKTSRRATKSKGASLRLGGAPTGAGSGSNFSV